MGINSHITRKEKGVSVMMGMEESLKGRYWAVAIVEGDKRRESFVDNSSDTSVRKAMVNHF